MDKFDDVISYILLHFRRDPRTLTPYRLDCILFFSQVLSYQLYDEPLLPLKFTITTKWRLRTVPYTGLADKIISSPAKYVAHGDAPKISQPGIHILREVLSATDALPSMTILTMAARIISPAAPAPHHAISEEQLKTYASDFDMHPSHPTTAAAVAYHIQNHVRNTNDWDLPLSPQAIHALCYLLYVDYAIKYGLPLFTNRMSATQDGPFVDRLVSQTAIDLSQAPLLVSRHAAFVTDFLVHIPHKYSTAIIETATHDAAYLPYWNYKYSRRYALTFDKIIAAHQKAMLEGENGEGGH